MKVIISPGECQLMVLGIKIRRQLLDISSSASRPMPWITRLWQALRGILANTHPRLPQASHALMTTDYTAHHLQGGLQLLDLVIRKWTGQKYSPQKCIQNSDINDNRRTTAAQLAYAAHCPAIATLKQSLATEVHGPSATTYRSN